MLLVYTSPVLPDGILCYEDMIEIVLVLPEEGELLGCLDRTAREVFLLRSLDLLDQRFCTLGLSLGL